MPISCFALHECTLSRRKLHGSRVVLPTVSQVPLCARNYTLQASVNCMEIESSSGAAAHHVCRPSESHPGVERRRGRLQGKASVTETNLTVLEIQNWIDPGQHLPCSKSVPGDCM